MTQETFKQRKFVIGPFVFTEAYEGVVISLVDCQEICINIGGSLPDGARAVASWVGSCFGRFSTTFEQDLVGRNIGWKEWVQKRSVQDAIKEYRAFVNDIQTCREDVKELENNLQTAELLLRAKERALQVVEVV